jgi:hypothetical protein
MERCTAWHMLMHEQIQLRNNKFHIVLSKGNPPIPASFFFALNQGCIQILWLPRLLIGTCERIITRCFKHFAYRMQNSIIHVV